MGTILIFHLHGPSALQTAHVDEQLSLAFDFCEDLEQKFSKFREMSDVSRLNQASLATDIPVSPEFARIFPLAEKIWQVSEGAFDPFAGLSLSRGDCPILLRADGTQHFARRTRDCQLDLSGIAKGFIVDELTDFLLARLPGLSGVVNAGGDLRFFATQQRLADIRLTTPERKFQRLSINQDGLATSAQTPASDDPLSTTQYHQTPRSGLGATDAVTAVAGTCALADALTKVGWFAPASICQRTVEKFAAEILVFDSTGIVREKFI